ncbi:MAG: methyl-accepting chemotaxis protein [bacterium]|jgi:methyl-accepting chemotaxis protein
MFSQLKIRERILGISICLSFFLLLVGMVSYISTSKMQKRLSLTSQNLSYKIRFTKNLLQNSASKMAISQNYIREKDEKYIQQFQILEQDWFSILSKAKQYLSKSNALKKITRLEQLNHSYVIAFRNIETLIKKQKQLTNQIIVNFSPEIQKDLDNIIQIAQRENQTKIQEYSNNILRHFLLANLYSFNYQENNHPRLIQRTQLEIMATLFHLNRLKIVLKKEQFPSKSRVQNWVTRINKDLQKFEQTTKQLFSNIQQSNQLFKDKFQNLTQKIRFLSEQLEKDSLQELSTVSREINQSAKQVNMIVLAVTIIALIIGGFVSFIIIRSITNPIQELVVAFKDIAQGEGDLTKRISIRREDEIGELSYWFNRFVKNVQLIVRKIGDNATTLAASSEELAATAEQMKRTSDEIAATQNESAASIIQSSNTIQELSTSVRETEQHIQEVQELANSAEESANEGAESVEQTTVAMGKIEESSSKIEGIIEVITEIAGQTNLLSLNAAIEAAKAGESGKGFAVVAEEVRNLAERSSNSVTEIRGLIDVSTINVTNGRVVTEKTKNVLENIIEKITIISDQVDGITSTINEQSIGLQEVAKGTEEISTVTDSNANSINDLSQAVDQTTVTIHELNRIADELRDEVAHFRT